MTTLTRTKIFTIETDVLSWLETKSLFPSFYWCSRNREEEVAAIGCVDRLQGTDFEVMKKAEAGFRYYGGAAFDDVKNEWEDFGRVTFFLPRFEMVRKGNLTKLYCYACDEEITSQTKRTYPEIFGREDIPNENDWKKKIDTALELIRSDQEILEKVVLARKTTFSTTTAFSSVQILKKLKEKMTGCTIFSYSPCEGKTFLGATPEHLYMRKGKNITTEAIAGTRPRSEDVELGFV